jgi:hypothetical protein
MNDEADRRHSSGACLPIRNAERTEASSPNASPPCVTCFERVLCDHGQENSSPNGRGRPQLPGSTERPSSLNRREPLDERMLKIAAGCKVHRQQAGPISKRMFPVGFGFRLLDHACQEANPLLATEQTCSFAPQHAWQDGQLPARRDTTDWTRRSTQGSIPSSCW